MPPIRRVPQTVQLHGLPTIHANAAGMDSGAEEIVVAVPPDRDAQPVRAFRTFTPDLHALAAWLEACGIDTVAMESTGVYWIPIFELLEAHGLVLYLVNARHAKIVPGRKSDWNDAQWLQKLHALGLLQASFRPDGEIVALRTLVRYRAQVIDHRSPHVNHMQQALKVMNLQLSEVLTDITGTTGMAIIRAIVVGERDPVTLAQFRNAACKSSRETIAKALTGTWKDEQLFVLQQALALYDAYTAQLAACDTRSEQALQAMESPSGDPHAPLPDLPPAKGESNSKNRASFNARAQVARIVGVDLVAVTGISGGLVQTIISEIGTDMSRFPSEKHFCSWLGLAPRNDISGGKVLRSRTMKVASRANQAFRMAAQAVSRTDTAFSAYYRAMRARKGPQQAIVTTAHKIARTVYHLLKTGEAYVA
jgi:transposase